MSGPPATREVAILGATGDLGFGLALRWAQAGVAVTIGSRSSERALEAAGRVRAALPGADVEGAANAEAVAAADVVVLSVPFAAQLATLEDVRPSLRAGQLLVDCTVPLATATGGKPTQILGLWHGSAAQQARASAPADVAVVSAFHTVSAATLADIARPLDEDVLLCGDRKADKARLARLVARIPGLRPVNAGGLDVSRIVEQLTPLLISVNIRYRTHAGLRVLGLPAGEHWSQA